MTGEIFWKRVSNAARFLDDALNELLSGHSVILNFQDKAPWEDVMIDVIREKLLPHLNYFTIDSYSAQNIGDPCEFLLQNYFDKREQMNHRLALGSMEEFMAKNDNTTMHLRFILVTDIPTAKVHQWITTVTNYLKHCSDQDLHAVFILITSGSQYSGSESLVRLSYNDYISEYDCLILCMNLLSELKYSILVKKYISELAVQLAGNRLEYAGQLAERKLDLIQNTNTIVREVFPELTAEGAAVLTAQSLWEVQIRIVYPELERFRRSFVKKYQTKLQEHLPLIDSSNEQLTEVDDLELGQLFYLCSTYHVAEQNDYEQLCHMRTARNNLAHGKTVSYEDLHMIGIC